ncbi:MAG: hypothetical protein O2887_00660 [Bacteroidetes bacterium]|nr:hypothetical protein [Bacteroidota bacterium]MDA1119000.1 hypothetical protein [Bacteroidota bacterium]
MRYFLLFFVLLFSARAICQVEIPNLPDNNLLDYTNSIPPDLMSSRSVVFIDFPDIKGNVALRGDWKGFGRKVHEEFKRIGIDAVAYYHLSDFYSGVDATIGFMKLVKTRNIENLIFISQANNALGTEIEIIIVPNQAPDRLLIPNQKAYRLQGTELRTLTQKLGRDIYRANLVNKNFLIIDQPEFFTDTDVVKGRRYETFSRDLNVGKLAVPLFSKYTFPTGMDSSDLKADKVRIIQDYNAAIDRLNYKLGLIMENYPYKYELVDYSVGEDHLYRREFSYVLMYLHAPGRNIRELLNYEIDYTETDYITLKTIMDEVTTLEQISVNAPVYKYYMKQLVNKEIYMGTQWDADLTWEGALLNHINNFKQALEDENN